jgi:PIN domain nuclease of toxin-antitoxin system
VPSLFGLNSCIKRIISDTATLPGREAGAIPRAGAKATVRRFARDHLGRPRVLRTLAGRQTRGLGATSPNPLLDTGALLWWLTGDRHCRQQRTAMADARNAVFGSAAIAWEIITKSRTSKLPRVSVIAADLGPVLDAQGFIPLPISFWHGQRPGALPGPLRDRSDRMLIAQAMHDDMLLAPRTPGPG